MKDFFLNLKVRLVYLYWNIVAAFVIKFCWNEIMYFLEIENSNIDLIQAAILWAISI